MSETPFLWQPGTIGALVIEVGIRALHAQKAIRGETKEDNTLVTEADTEAESFLTKALGRLHPSARVLGEETWAQDGFEAISDELDKDYFILDPIDGTAMYAAGLSAWGVSLGYASGGKLCHGAVFLPGSGELFLTTDLKAGYLRLPLDRFGIPMIPTDGTKLPDYVSERLEPLQVRESQPVKLVGVTQYVAKGLPFEVPYVVLSTGSFVVSMLNLARGSFSGYLGKAKIWDMAGAWPIARQTGVKSIMVPSGKPFDVALDKGPWVWSTQDPSFLGLHEHVFFYRDEEVANVCRQTLDHWPEKM